MQMISITEAISLIKEHTPAPEHAELRPLSEAIGHVLFEDILAPISMPPFQQSAMDGYAVCMHEGSNYQLLGEIKAGDTGEAHLNPGEAIRIFTGAKVPDTANAVIMQEKVRVHGTTIEIAYKIPMMENIRPIGEQVKKDALALKKGTALTAAGIGFLASLGITSVSVFSKPSIAIVVTGNELVAPGESLGAGKIYESNGIMLQSVLKYLGYSKVESFKAKDDFAQTKEQLEQALSTYDITLVSGGISVGDYDFVGKALNAIGVTEIFYKVHQKPGKPLYFGKRNDALVFGLPGNPAASLSCFYLYVLNALEIRSGNPNFQLHTTQAKLLNSFHGRSGRPQFLKAYYRNGEVAILDGQNSSMLHTFALANALVFKPETADALLEGSIVDVNLLP